MAHRLSLFFFLPSFSKAKVDFASAQSYSSLLERVEHSTSEVSVFFFFHPKGFAFGSIHLLHLITE